MAPTHSHQEDWQEGNNLCSFCTGGHCLMGCFCPCMLINKTDVLLKDPKEKDPSGCGKACFGWSALNMCGVGFIIPIIQRGKIRSKYGFKERGCNDICVNLCCPCCSVIQQYKELEMRRDAGVDTKGYQGEAPMRRQ